jgi:hypothetical protein
MRRAQRVVPVVCLAAFAVVPRATGGTPRKDMACAAADALFAALPAVKRAAVRRPL